jgi:hypothetical protein
MCRRPCLLAVLAAIGFAPAWPHAGWAQQAETIFSEVKLVGYVMLHRSGDFDVAAGDVIEIIYEVVSDPGGNGTTLTMALSNGWSDQIINVNARRTYKFTQTNAARLTVDGRLDGWDPGDWAQFSVRRYRSGPPNFRAIAATIRPDGGFDYGYRGGPNAAPPGKTADVELFYAKDGVAIGAPIDRHRIVTSSNAAGMFSVPGSKVPVGPIGVNGLKVIVNRMRSIVEDDYKDNEALSPISGDTQLEIDPPRFDFGPIKPRETKRAILQIRNKGPRWSLLSFDVKRPPGVPSIKLSGARGTVQGGGTATVVVDVSGSGPKGEFNEVLVLSTNAPNVPAPGTVSIDIRAIKVGAVPVNFSFKRRLTGGEHLREWASNFTGLVGLDRAENQGRSMHWMAVEYTWGSSSGHLRDLRNGRIVEELRFMNPSYPLGTFVPYPPPWDLKPGAGNYCWYNIDAPWSAERGSMLDGLGDDEQLIARPPAVAGEMRIYQTFWYIPDFAAATAGPVRSSSFQGYIAAGKAVVLWRNVIRHMVDPTRGSKGQVEIALVRIQDNGGTRRLARQIGDLNFDVVRPKPRKPS